MLTFSLDMESLVLVTCVRSVEFGELILIITLNARNVRVQSLKYVILQFLGLFVRIGGCRFLQT